MVSQTRMVTAPAASCVFRIVHVLDVSKGASEFE
jgi:hypothetical protein